MGIFILLRKEEGQKDSQQTEVTDVHVKKKKKKKKEIKGSLHIQLTVI